MDEVEEFTRINYADVAMSFGTESGEFGYEHSSLEIGRFAVNELRVRGRWWMRVAPLAGVHLVGHIRHGVMNCDSVVFGRRTGTPGDTALAPPQGEFEQFVDGVVLETVVLDAVDVADHAARLFGITPRQFAFTGRSPISRALHTYWTDTIAHVRVDVLGNPAAAASAIAVQGAFHSLASALIAVFPSTGPGAAEENPMSRGSGRSAVVPPAVLREVREFLDAHAGHPLTSDHLVALTGRPTREITDALRRHSGTSPSRLLWNARLRGVHRDLADADPSPTGTGAPADLIGRIVAGWGFTRPVPFRRAYVHVFGESPEQTLHN